MGQGSWMFTRSFRTQAPRHRGSLGAEQQDDAEEDANHFTSDEPGYGMRLMVRGGMVSELCVVETLRLLTDQLVSRIFFDL